MDPRVKTPAAGIQQMFSLQMRLASLLTTSSVAVIQTRAVQEQLEKLSGSAFGSVKEAIEKLKQKLKTVLGGGPQSSRDVQEATLNHVCGTASSLYAEVDR